MANPYAAHLGDRDPRAVLAATPGMIHQAVCAMTPEQIEEPIAPGRWSPRLIVAHLADCELAHSWRLRQVLAAPVAEPRQLEPFDQDAWAQHYSGYDLPAALELFRAARGWNIKLIGTLSRADLERQSYHPERGAQTFYNILEMMAGHDLNHVVQLQRLVNPTV